MARLPRCRAIRGHHPAVIGHEGLMRGSGAPHLGRSSHWSHSMDSPHSQAIDRDAAACVTAEAGDDRVIETDIPSRLDHLTWSGFHTRVVLALGITWILDGLEVTLAGSPPGALRQ